MVKGQYHLKMINVSDSKKTKPMAIHVNKLTLLNNPV